MKYLQITIIRTGYIGIKWSVQGSKYTLPIKMAVDWVLSLQFNIRYFWTSHRANINFWKFYEPNKKRKQIW